VRLLCQFDPSASSGFKEVGLARSEVVLELCEPLRPPEWDQRRYERTSRFQVECGVDMQSSSEPPMDNILWMFSYACLVI
jgi:hypothetical protein